MFCGALATLLCDGVLGCDADTDLNGRITHIRKLHTCDVPMCRDCATWHGNIFFSGRPHSMDTRDYCPACEGREEVVERASLRRVMTDDQAKVVRLAHWATHQNDHQRKLQILQGVASSHCHSDFLFSPLK